MGELIQINGHDPDKDKHNKSEIGSAQWKEDRLRSLPYWDELKESTPDWKKYLEPKGNFIERAKSSKIDNQESSYFFKEIRNLIPKEQWLYLMDELERIDLNSEETVDIDGRQYKDQEPEAVYIDLAADLKDIDEEGFEKNVVDKRKKWLKLGDFLDSRREDIDNFLYYAYNLKILYPQKFSDGEFKLDEKVFGQTINKLTKLSEEKNWGEFTDLS